MRVSVVGRIFPIGLAILSLAGAASAGRIQGSVTLTGPTGPANAELNPYAGTLGSVPKQEPTGTAVEDVVIYIEDDHILPAAKPRTFRMAQKGQRFEPRVLAIPVGSTVEFPNSDPVFHNVFSYSRTRRFDLGRYGKGQSKGVQFDRAGLVKVFCEIHSDMSAFIRVVDGPLVTQPAADGSFTLGELPPGTYQVVVWHPDRGERRIPVTVEADRPTQLDLAL